MPPEDVEAMTELLTRLSPKRIMEFGTNWGVTTALFLLNSSPETRIWTVDICREMLSTPASPTDELAMCLPKAKTGWAYRQLPTAARVTQVFQDSLKLDWSESDFPLHFDLIFIDACHEYEFVISDTKKALSRLHPGGILLWHDFYPSVSSWPGVFRAVSEFAKAHPGVVHLKGTHIAAWRSPDGNQ